MIFQRYRVKDSRISETILDQKLLPLSWQAFCGTAWHGREQCRVLPVAAIVPLLPTL